MTSWPLGSLLMSDWMTWKSILGLSGTSSSALWTHERHKCCWSWVFLDLQFIWCECVWSLTVSSSLEMLVWGASSPGSRGSCPGLYGPRPPDSWTTVRAAAGTHHDSMTDTGSPKRNRQRSECISFRKHVGSLGSHLGRATERYCFWFKFERKSDLYGTCCRPFGKNNSAIVNPYVNLHNNVCSCYVSQRGYT